MQKPRWTQAELVALRKAMRENDNWDDVATAIKAQSGRDISCDGLKHAAHYHFGQSRLTGNPEGRRARRETVNWRNGIQPRWSREMVEIADSLTHLSARSCAEEMNRQLGRSDITRNMVIGWRWRQGRNAA